jgi:hypothetical protein
MYACKVCALCEPGSAVESMQVDDHLAPARSAANSFPWDAAEPPLDIHDDMIAGTGPCCAISATRAFDAFLACGVRRDRRARKTDCGPHPNPLP